METENYYAPGGEPSPSAELNKNQKLSKQLPMSEVSRNRMWERRQRRWQRQRSNAAATEGRLTDEDMNELKGCIELGFGFSEENGERLCPTIPALNLYFAVNRQFATSPLSSPISNANSAATTPSAASIPSPRANSDSRKILIPGDDPQQVKARLRHWAQAVACSVLQSPRRSDMDSTDQISR